MSLSEHNRRQIRGARSEECPQANAAMGFSHDKITSINTEVR